MKAIDIYNVINEFAPVETALPGDNVGFLVGDKTKEIKKILVALDPTLWVIEEAIEFKADLIFTHHPIAYIPIRSLVLGEPEADKIAKLIKNDIALIAMHTNLDAAKGGINDVLFELYGLENQEPFGTGERKALCRIGYTEATDIHSYAKKIKEAVNFDALRYLDAGKHVNKVGFGSGNNSDSVEEAFKLGCDTFISADFKYNHWLSAKELGINIIDAGHFNSENVICAPMIEMLKNSFPNLDISRSKTHGDFILTCP